MILEKDNCLKYNKKLTQFAQNLVRKHYSLFCSSTKEPCAN